MCSSGRTYICSSDTLTRLDGGNPQWFSHENDLLTALDMLKTEKINMEIAEPRPS